MSACTGVAAEEDLERYLKGTLPELQACSFEEHYFDCPVCLAHVEAMEAVSMKLAVEPKARPRELRPKTPVLWPYYLAEGVAATIVLGLIALGAIHLMRRQPGAAVASHAAPAMPSALPPLATNSALAQLADTSLPVVEASHLHSGGASSEFSNGMAAYAKHDCTSALALLVQVPRSDADSVAAQFYTGLCQMQKKQWVSAADTLKDVAYKGESPQQEAAFYYLAQAELERDNAVGAEQDLVRTVVLHGDFEHRATAELDLLRSTPAH